MSALPRWESVLVLRKANSRASHLPFWFMPFSILGMLLITGFITDSLSLTILPSLAPHRVMLAVPRSPHRVGFIFSE